MAGNKLYYYDFQDKKLQELSFPDKELLHIVSRQSYSSLLFSNGEIAQVDWENKNCSEDCFKLELPRSGEHRIYMDTQFRLWIYTIYTPIYSVMIFKIERCLSFLAKRLYNRIL